MYRCIIVPTYSTCCILRVPYPACHLLYTAGHAHVAIESCTWPEAMGEALERGMALV